MISHGGTYYIEYDFIDARDIFVTNFSVITWNGINPLIYWGISFLSKVPWVEFTVKVIIVIYQCPPMYELTFL